jgi:hypothetical protein
MHFIRLPNVTAAGNRRLPHRRRSVIAQGVVVASLIVSAAPAMAGCNSGSDPITDLLTSANCQASASRAGATGIGFVANATAVNSTAVGYNSTAYADSSVALGANATASGVASIGIGTDAGLNAGSLNNSQNSAIGLEAGRFVTGSYNVAFGSSSGDNVVGHSNVAIGLEAGDAISSSDTVAVGTKSRATASGAIAIGSKAVAKFSQSVAIGVASTTSEANVVSVGAPGHFRRVMNVANAAAANDAVNLAQLKALIKAGKPVAEAQPSRVREEMQATIDLQGERIAALERRLGDLEKLLGRSAVRQDD